MAARLAAAFVAGAAIGAYFAWTAFRKAPRAPAAVAAIAPAALVVARGHIVPADRVHLVSGPSTSGTVADLHVSEGDLVRAGDLLATLDTNPRDAGAVLAAEQDVRLATSQLDQVAAGSKRSEVDAQDALVGARRAEAERASQQLARSRELLARNFISADALEQQVLEHRRAAQLLEQAQAGLKALTEIRAVDLQVARARVDQSRARLLQARAQMTLSEIRAPVDGTILAIHVRKGQSLGSEGLASIGNLDRLMVLAQINEQDALRIAIGQAATVVLRGQADSFRGQIAKVMAQVADNDSPTTDVLRGRDARVAEAEVAIAPGQPLPRLVGMEVIVTVDTGAVPSAR